MRNLQLSTFILGSLLFASSLSATLTNEKITLEGNMLVKYNKLPPSASTISQAFNDGLFYGRLRTNMFVYDWKQESNTRQDHKAMGVGGSFIYKTAPLYGISATAGLYTSQNPVWFNEDVEDVGIVKSGKDTFSRRDTSLSGNYGMTVLAQAFMQYDIAKSSVVAGRQMFESVFTKSNDTKMIPNTFDGLSLKINELQKTTIKLAYFTAQKLRDHTVAHDVLAYNPDDRWSQNDDGAVNKNLTVQRIGSNNTLLVTSLTNRSVENLKLNLSYMMVPDVVSNVTFETHYAMKVTKDWKIVPGLRYMQQFDNLGASYDVANLSASSSVGYSDAKSLDSSLIALRIDVKNSAFLARLGYSYIADEADIVAPWRGFPTGGFTRAMAQYNWRANTTTYMARVGYDFSKAQIIDGFSFMVRYAIEDFDDSKDEVQADSRVIHIDARQNIGNNIEAKLRIGLVSVDNNILKSNGVDYKSDTSYNEYRFELNYFF